MEQFSRFFLPGGLLLITLASGLWLSHIGRPINGLLLAAHKLIALAGLVLAGIQFARLIKVATPAFGIAFLAVAAISALALFASGALLSQAKPAAAFILRIHQIAPVLLVAGLIMSVVVFINGKL